MISPDLASSASSVWLDAVLSMKGIHGVKLATESSRRHNCFNNVWEIPLDQLCAKAPFVMCLYDLTNRTQSSCQVWETLLGRRDYVAIPRPV